MPYGGVNPHSVVIPDNCAIHHILEVWPMLEEVGVPVHFLPPYSPDLNPIEEAFSKPILRQTLMVLLTLKHYRRTGFEC